MSLNPNNHTTSADGTAIIGIEGGMVTAAPEHTPGDNVAHHVTVTTDHFDTPKIAEVPVTHIGDVNIPTVGSRVLLAHRVNERPLVLGTRYPIDEEIPAYKAGERRIGHPLTDAHIFYDENGIIHAESPDGTTTVDITPQAAGGEEFNLTVSGTKTALATAEKDGSLYFEAADGDSFVDLPKDGTLTVDAVDGDVTVDVASDGSVSISAANGSTTVDLNADGSVVVNGGSTRPIVDISTTTDSDGHVTSVSTTRAQDTYVQSN